MHKLINSKKGISPILAIVLLVMITVAATVVTYAWVMTFLGAQTGAGGTILSIENMYWNSTASTTSIVIRNIGTSDARIVRLYIGNSASNLLDVTTATDLGASGRLLPVNQVITMVLAWPNILANSWIEGAFYYFRIVPEVGASHEFVRQAYSG